MNRNECCSLDPRRNHRHVTFRTATALCAAILLLLAGCRMGRVADIPAAVVPTVTIEAGTSPVAEGDALRFTVRAAPAPTEDLTVRVSLQESGVMLAAEQPTMVRIAKGRTTATLTVDTMGDDEAELDSTVTATVSSGTGYQLGSAVSASVIVTDDDDPAPPVVTIAAAAATVAEGMVAEFTVRADPAPATDLVVGVAVTETGAMLADSAPATVTIGAGTAMVTLSVATVDDEADESDSMVTATLFGAAGYTLGMPVSASVTVSDDDDPPPEPTVMIAAGSVVTGAAAVEFTVQADPAPRGPDGERDGDRDPRHAAGGRNHDHGDGDHPRRRDDGDSTDIGGTRKHGERRDERWGRLLGRLHRGGRGDRGAAARGDHRTDRDLGNRGRSAGVHGARGPGAGSGADGERNGDRDRQHARRGGA